MDGDHIQATAEDLFHLSVVNSPQGMNTLSSEKPKYFVQRKNSFKMKILEVKPGFAGIFSFVIYQSSVWFNNY